MKKQYFLFLLCFSLIGITTQRVRAEDSLSAIFLNDLGLHGFICGGGAALAGALSARACYVKKCRDENKILDLDVANVDLYLASEDINIDEKEKNRLLAQVRYLRNGLRETKAFLSAFLKASGISLGLLVSSLLLWVFSSRYTSGRHTYSVEIGAYRDELQTKIIGLGAGYGFFVYAFMGVLLGLKNYAQAKLLDKDIAVLRESIKLEADETLLSRLNSRLEGLQSARTGCRAWSNIHPCLAGICGLGFLSMVAMCAEIEKKCIPLLPA